MPASSDIPFVALRPHTHMHVMHRLGERSCARLLAWDVMWTILHDQLWSRVSLALRSACLGLSTVLESARLDGGDLGLLSVEELPYIIPSLLRSSDDMLHQLSVSRRLAHFLYNVRKRRLRTDKDALAAKLLEDKSETEGEEMGHARMPSSSPSAGKKVCEATPLRPSSSMASSPAKQCADTAHDASEAARDATFRVASPAALLPAATPPATALSRNDASASKTHKSDFVLNIFNKADALGFMHPTSSAATFVSAAQQKDRTDGAPTKKMKTSDDAVALTSFSGEQQQQDLACKTGWDDVLFLRVAGTSNFERACRAVNADGQTVKIVRNPEAKDAEKALRCSALNAPVAPPPEDNDTWSHTQSIARDDSERVELCPHQGQQAHRLRLQPQGLLGHICTACACAET